MVSVAPLSDSQYRSVKVDSGNGSPAANPYAAMNHSRRSRQIGASGVPLTPEYRRRRGPERAAYILSRPSGRT